MGRDGVVAEEERGVQLGGRVPGSSENSAAVSPVPYPYDDVMEIAPGCFVCEPVSEEPAEEAYSWSRPRLACCGYETARLEDGTPLEDVLQAITPAGWPLEGSGISDLLGIVTFSGPCGEVQGLTSFAAGGRAFFEVRFGASSPTEWVACETPGIVSHLCVARDEGLGYRESLSRMIALMGEDSSRGRAVAKFFDFPSANLVQLLRKERAIMRSRSTANKRWPWSPEEVSRRLSFSVSNEPPRPEEWPEIEDLFRRLKDIRLAHVPRWSRPGG